MPDLRFSVLSSLRAGHVHSGDAGGDPAATGQLWRVVRSILWLLVFLAAGPEFLRFLLWAFVVIVPLGFAWGILQALTQERAC